ncbi:TIR domain-containing protein [Sorangium atrum]|uniref:TIR domain-containing protein n=1 Tax=Sorangium atrum TaxID=2995308 RepID=A0ABT5C541_9BACT|nr:TIR domain-containing protein [Sorangium aterium]MDC0681542.1 TIR domain-containing protein [Sorangium aterium]
MPYLKTYDLFISHAWDYNDEYYRLVAMLDGAPNFKWRNYSVPEHDPLAGGRRLAQQLDGQIRPVNAVLILAGMYVNHRGWIQKEIELAQSYNKPLIGIRPWGNYNVPQVVAMTAETIVGWKTDSIVGAVRAHAI